MAPERACSPSSSSLRAGGVAMDESCLCSVSVPIQNLSPTPTTQTTPTTARPRESPRESQPADSEPRIPVLARDAEPTLPSIYPRCIPSASPTAKGEDSGADDDMEDSGNSGDDLSESGTLGLVSFGAEEEAEVGQGALSIPELPRLVSLDSQLFVEGLPEVLPVQNHFPGNGNGSKPDWDDYLDNVLGQEFSMRADAGNGDGGDDPPGTPGTPATPGSTRPVKTFWTQEGLKTEIGDEKPLSSWRQSCGSLAEHKWWVSCFMTMTIYALYAPDLDELYGTQESSADLRVSTSIVACMFLVEILVQCFGKPGYMRGAYFWLDSVALISLIPDTYLIQLMSDNNAFVAGRSSRLTRMIRVATQSSRVARLNRLSRMVRVAALIPRLQRLMGHKVEENDTERLLEKKLYRVFCFLDEDFDGYVSRPAGQRCQNKLLDLAKIKAPSRWGYKLRRQMSRVQTRTFTEDPPTAFGISQAKELMSYEEFQNCLMKDVELSTWLRKTVGRQLKQGNNMQSVRQRNSDYIGVKVALSVLAILFILSISEAVVEDTSFRWGFQTICSLVKKQHGGISALGLDISKISRSQVELWIRGVPENSASLFFAAEQTRQLLYLEVERAVFCNQILTTDHCVLPNRTASVWDQRESLHQIDQDLTNSKIRLRDLVLLRSPDFDSEDRDVSAEEMERQTHSLAIVQDRAAVEMTAKLSLLTTSLVIVIILSGITMLTKDLTYLSRNLLKPLVELTDEIESIARLDLAGAYSSQAEDTKGGPDLSEIRLMRRSFDNMKMAIRSWGKYVPWPVVHLMLRKDAGANLEVTEKEVSVFFSDIEGFTSIGASLPPERQLLLLSRYFHDMSQVIEDHGGIVLEFIGDAIMSIYGAPLVNEAHPAAAVESAIQMLAALTTMNHWFAARNLPKLRIRCGVHTGKVSWFCLGRLVICSCCCCCCCCFVVVCCCLFICYFSSYTPCNCKVLVGNMGFFIVVSVLCDLFCCLFCWFVCVFMVLIF
ncbi:unnamed protein product [Polarella glacialis]|uniref:Guanylate cyclase domain-containing protein n=1 Tax=Polarella glacialis TaxID=89957 RepID=A0A813KT26_POLGL|nr:unnamed protein product [Polarella glacialis]